MKPQQASDAETAEATKRLKGFCKPANQCKDNFDPERMRESIEGADPRPKTVSWIEVRRKLRNY